MCRLIVALLAVACAAPAKSDVRFETVASGLNHPWSIAFLPDGAMLVTERVGRLRVIRNSVLQPEPVTGVPDVYVAGQGGLFDVVVDPDFDSNRTIYLTFAWGDAGANATRVVRARLDGNALDDVSVLFTAKPVKDTPHHYGARMLVLPDRTLLITVGDGFDFREQAQRLDNHLGKVVRIDRFGRVPAGNPYVDTEDALPEIWSYGHRNPQGIVLHPASGVVYLHEHGPRGGDELNELEAGVNYGWPAISYGIDYSYARVTPYTSLPGMRQPILEWTPSIAPSGMTVYDGVLFPEWVGDLFVTALVEQSVRRIEVAGGRVVGQERLFDAIGERLRDIRTGPDGALYVLTDNEDGRVIRVVPAGE